MRIAGTLAVFAALLASAGCGKNAEDQAPAAAPKPETSPTAQTFDAIGTWIVTGHVMPGVSSMNEDAAKARHGQTLELTETEATSSGEHCATPKYPTRDVPTEEFLATEFNLPPESLKEFEGRDQVTIVEISCDGAPWTAFGSLLLEIDADHVFTPWDGVFFELERSAEPAG